MTTHPPRDDHSRIIRASEVGEFVYCAHAWWLGSVEGKRPDDTGRLEAGSAAHEHHGRRVIASAVLTRLAYLLLLLAGMAGIGWLIGSLVG
jgi:hypothetical protein